MPQEGCPECAKLTGGCNRHSVSLNVGLVMTPVPAVGWICPTCSRGVAPHVKSCDHQSQVEGRTVFHNELNG